jgi:hypothetical protein
MIVVQDAYLPEDGGLHPLLDALRQVRRRWIERHGSDRAGRLLSPLTGLPRQVIWQFECDSFGRYEALRLDLERDEASAGPLRSADAASRDRLCTFHTVIGDHDDSAEVRREGVVVQARYVPRHGNRDRCLSLLREWQRDWAARHEAAMKGRVLGFTSTGVTHDLIWQAEYPSAAEYERAYGRWSASSAFDAWAREFRDSYATNTHAILTITDS